ncbi:MAG TPA: hypothetical protein DIT07_08300 [Sphingobacteriaceae bacterium]|nr:hypothetical protein [Sphingobacteriaceae bacterium]
MKFNIKNSIGKKTAVLMAGFVLIFSSSCQKFLTAIPTNAQTVDAQFTAVADGNALIIGPYRSLRNFTGGAGDFGNYLPSTLEFQHGKNFTADSHGLYTNFQNNEISGTMLDDFNKPWQDWYQGVRDANFSIDRLPLVTDFTDVQRKAGLGEVRALRAWYYLNLVRMFGDVVMITKPLANIADAQQPRTSLKTIFDEVIIPDLEFAVNEAGLADAQSSTGRVTKQVARAILADAYLTAAGYPYQEVATDPTKEWCTKGLWTMQGYPVNSASSKDFYKKAKEQLDALFGKYSLGTYDDLHNPAKNNQVSMIWQIQMQQNSEVIAAALPGLSLISVYGTEYGTHVPSIGYYKSYDPADKRAQEKQMFYTFDNKAASKDASMPLVVFPLPHLYKFYDASAVKVDAKSSLNWTMYRYADILLMQTEANWALIQLGEPITEAEEIKGINAVRAVANLPAYRGIDINVTTILAERAYELVYECKLQWDYRRMRTALIDGAGKFTSQNFIGHKPAGFTFNFTAQNLLSPISGTEILNNLKCLQNFGYTPKQAGQ